MANHHDFEIIPYVTPADIPRLCDMTLDGWAEDPIWQGMVRNASREDAFKLLSSIHEKRVGNLYYKYFKINAKATGHVKLVAWTALLCPQPEDVAAQTRQQMLSMKAPAFPGIDKRMAMLFVSTSTVTYGYDPVHHFHRRGTFVDAEYQRRGLGFWLSEQCDRIADKAGAATFVTARNSSKPLFEKSGFQIVATVDVDVKGDGTEVDYKHVMKRDPK